MGDKVTVTARTFQVREGMTPEDVKKSPNATAMQKKMAAVFDSDGNNVYSAREAAVFNATAISNHGKDGVSLWTNYADGTRKETLVKGNLESFRYAPEGKVKTMTYKSGKPQAKTIEKKSGFKYVPPQVGKSGIEAADTAYFTGTDKISSITYYNDKAKTKAVHEARYNKEGKLKEFTWLRPETKYKGFVDYTTYSPNGKAKYDGYTGDGKFLFQSYDNNERMSYQTEYDIASGRELKTIYYGNDGYTVNSEYINNKDGSTTTKRVNRDRYGVSTGKTVIDEDSKGNKLREKQFDTNDVLQYTVIPKRNSEGDIIKNDTIWNNQK